MLFHHILHSLLFLSDSRVSIHSKLTKKDISKITPSVKWEMTNMATLMTRAFPVDKIFSVVQLLIFDFVEVFGHNRNLFRTLSNILGWSVLRILLPVKLIYYFCKMLHLRCLAGFWIGLCIRWRVERSLAQNILSQNRKS